MTNAGRHDNAGWGGMVGGNSGAGAGGARSGYTVLQHGPPAPTPAASSNHAATLHASLSESLYSSLRSFYESMTNNFSDTCQANCSGRGECLNGTCVCLVQYEGDTCREPNLAYFISFATVFYLIAAVSLAQLVVCVRAEYMRQKTPSLRRACRVTTQKMLYVITFVAATLRGAYFSSPANADLKLAPSFVSAFYPIILSGGSLIVCFWAEAFHLRDIRCERPRFLSKSFCGFLTFNVLTYSLLVAEILLTRQTGTQEERSFFTHIFNGCYAVLLFIVVVFFLIYGVEVYFKVRGGFIDDTIIVGHVHSRTPPQDLLSHSLPPLLNSSDTDPSSSSPSFSTETSLSSSTSSPLSSLTPLAPSSPSKKKFFPKSASEDRPSEEQDPSTQRLVPEQVNVTLISVFIKVHGCGKVHIKGKFKLHQFAPKLDCVMCFCVSLKVVPLMSRNAYDIIFRVVELGVALWFPCVLWNCMSPEQLWILNPKKILKKLDIDRSLELGQKVPQKSDGASADGGAECWICYDTERTDAGPLIQPCDCRGDVGAVHHHCLRKWLMECAENSSENLSCKVCGAVYQLERGRAWWIGQGFTTRHWLQTASLVTVMCGTIAGAWTLIQMYDDAYIRSLAAGATLLIIYVCLKFLGFNTFSAYQRARYSAVKILGRHFAQRETCPPVETGVPAASGNVSTISSEVLVDMNATGVPKMPEATI
ncbi:uncharacterized protein LOC123515882 [Portunus trituberculatus]|uniref:uncharacterized protein LOC123515882 n=1 Tax=Portunus trituberculatus TaxID=210409 RepID=UPI001E1D1E5C|nr:uncharacterized protein LOC123515882 [Portunus trituberculatus]